MRRLAFASCVLAAMGVAFANGPVAVETVFSEGTLPEGWSICESGLLSPTYSNYVSHISLAYGEERSGVYGTLTLFATDYTTQTESKIADLNTFTSAVQLDFPAGTDFRSFRFVTNGVALVSWTAVWMDTRLFAPTNIAIANNTGSSFDISWDPVENATGYCISVWTNKMVGAADGTVTWQETFTRMESGSGSALTTTTKNRLSFADHPEWTNETYGVTHTSGYHNGYLLDGGGGIRLGTSSATGSINVPHAIVAEENVVRIVAARYKSDKGQTLSVLCITEDGTATNLVGTLSLDANGVYSGTGDIEGAPGIVELSGATIGGRLLLQTDCGTDGKEARVAIKGITFVTGYAAGTEVCDVFRQEIVPADGAACTVSGLPSVAVNVSVQALAANAADTSVASEAAIVDLANPPPAPQLAVSGLRVSGEGGYVERFGAFTNQPSEIAWMDWLTLPYWQVCKGVLSVSKMTVKSGMAAKPTGGLYAYHGTNRADMASYSLAAVSNGTSDNNAMKFGFGVTNDSASAVLHGFELGFMARQWTFAETASNRPDAQAMHLEWLVTNAVVSVAAEGDWREVVSARFNAVYSLEAAGVDADYSTGSVSKAYRLSLENVELKPGQVLMLRWRQDRVSGGEALGVDDVEITCERRYGGMTVRVVKAD